MNWRADELDSFNNWNSNTYITISKTCISDRSINMAALKFNEIDWKDRQYQAHARLTRKRGWDFSDNNPYFERMMIVLPDPKIKTKQQMKEELKKHGYK